MPCPNGAWKLKHRDPEEWIGVTLTGSRSHKALTGACPGFTVGALLLFGWWCAL